MGQRPWGRRSRGGSLCGSGRGRPGRRRAETRGGESGEGGGGGRRGGAGRGGGVPGAGRREARLNAQRRAREAAIESGDLGAGGPLNCRCYRGPEAGGRELGGRGTGGAEGTTVRRPRGQGGGGWQLRGEQRGCPVGPQAHRVSSRAARGETEGCRRAGKGCRVAEGPEPGGGTWLLGLKPAVAELTSAKGGRAPVISMNLVGGGGRRAAGDAGCGERGCGRAGQRRVL